MRKNNFIENNPRVKKIAIVILFGVPVLLWLIFEVRYYLVDKEISNDNEIAIGVITKVKYGRNALVYWRYEVDGKKYRSYAAETREFNFVKYCPDRSCVGDTVEVEYSKENPERSRLVFHGMKSYR